MDDELSEEDLKEGYQKARQGFLKLRAYMRKYRGIRLIVEWIGSLSSIAFLFLGNYLYSFILWFMFFPDIEDIIRFCRKTLFRS